MADKDTTEEKKPAPTFLELLDAIEQKSLEERTKRAGQALRPYELETLEKDELLTAAMIAGGRYLARMVDALEAIAKAAATAKK